MTEKLDYSIVYKVLLICLYLNSSAVLSLTLNLTSEG